MSVSLKLAIALVVVLLLDTLFKTILNVESMTAIEMFVVAVSIIALNDLASIRKNIES